MNVLPLDIEKTHKVTKEFLTKSGLCGINNLGNTCFMNSIIQCLNHMIPLSTYFLENTFKKDLNTASDCYDIAIQWNIVVRGLWYRNSVISPGNFHKAVQQLAFTKGFTDFTGFGQNDSHEFMQFFLESLHNSVSRKVNMSIVGEAKNEIDKMAINSLKYWKQFFQDDYSPIIDIFYGQHLSKLLKVTNGKTQVSYTYDPFSCLSLEVSPKFTTMYDCLDSFTSKEKLSDESETNKVYKTISFWKLPKILMVFFKRFDNNGRKLNNHIDFPLENLNMSKYVSGYNKSESIYNLVAVSNHSGGCNGGHYFAYCKNADNNWYKFNDNVVSTLQTSRVVSSAAYCLFYVLK